ncbi:PEP-CTERM sorting domain-containing protein [Coleofasciculus sp. FACHB-SPT36]|uniref:Vgb family protein n=1 Tax=Cyanophyceae TaxID=3028117 RepID=UPI00168AFEF6|nr:PEP-CTERM sorting domain-containing protein [Coleofasciculus sp. FACHB-SPT36]MBD2539661.1 PEP-CTERM sorting domain-containing protein [Coleofasciculus sp. FACHB-SPT36]
MKTKTFTFKPFIKLLNLSALITLSTAAILDLGASGADAALLIGNTKTNNVVRYDDKTGKFLGDFIAPGSGGLSNPDDLVFGPDGNLYISSGSSSTGQILRYNGKTGAFIDVFASGGNLTRPYGMVFGPDGYLYVSSFLTDTILRYNATTGAFVDVFASGNRLPGGLNGPNDLLFTPDGKLLVSTQGSVAIAGDANTDGIISPGEFVPDFSQGLPSQILSYDIKTKQSAVLVDSATPLPNSFNFVSFLGLALSPKGDLFATDFANGLRAYDINSGALKATIPTDYTSIPGGFSNNFIGNLTFIGNTLFTVGFDFTKNDYGAILRYDSVTGNAQPSAGNQGAVFVSTNSNLQRPIGITSIASVPEPTATISLFALGTFCAVFLQKSKRKNHCLHAEDTVIN